MYDIAGMSVLLADCLLSPEDSGVNGDVYDDVCMATQNNKSKIFLQASYGKPFYIYPQSQPFRGVYGRVSAEKSLWIYDTKLKTNVNILHVISHVTSGTQVWNFFSGAKWLLA